MNKDTAKLSEADEYYANGQFERAERLLYEIVGRSPQQWGAWHRLAAVCLELGKVEHAVSSARKAVELQPDIAAFQARLGVVLRAAGKNEEAIAAYTKAVALSPSKAGIWFNLGNAFRDAGEADQASRCFQKALQLQPDFVQALHNLANLLAKQDAPQAALECYKQCVAKAPEQVRVWVDYGNLLGSLDRQEEAVQCYEQALQVDPDYVPALSNLGNVLRQQNRFEESLALFENALGSGTTVPAVWNNRGLTLTKLDRFEEAEASFAKALELQPDYANAFYNLGDLYTEQQEFDRGKEYYDKAIAVEPDHAEANYHLSHYYLRRGDFERGWPLYESRWRTREAAGLARKQDFPLWDGSDPTGKTLLVYTEQGAGDTFQFVRLLSELQSRGAKVILECSPRLQRILKPVAGIDAVVSKDAEQLPQCDFQVPLVSLPLHLGVSEADLPGTIPYLFAEPELQLQWKAKLSELPGAKLGIAWQGSTTNLRDRTRSFPLKCFGPIADVAGVQLVTLQKGPGADQLEDASFQIQDLGAELDAGEDGFIDTAAVMKELDLVITSDTSIAHLAGGLGVPVWVALNDVPEWRWQMDRAESPWYPTMRLFRQRERGNWEELFERIADELKQSLATLSRD